MVLVLNFIKFFRNDLNDLLLRSYQFSYDAGILTDKQREALLFSYLNAIKTHYYNRAIVPYNLIKYY